MDSLQSAAFIDVADDSMPAPLPDLSVIAISCDCLRTLRQVLASLSQQTVAPRLQVVIVSPSLDDRETIEDLLRGFADVRLLASPSDAYAGEQHAMGVREATAPFVAFVEDHATPAPDWAEQVVRAFKRSDYAGIGVAMHNANPRTALSWGNLMIGYLNWVAPVAAGEANFIPVSNATYRRDLLLPFGDELPAKLERGGDLQQSLRRQGYRFYIEPAARVYHRNFSRLGSTLRLRMQIGRLHAGERAAGKSLPGRLALALLAPVHPAMRLAKIVKRLIARQYPLRPRMVFGVAVGLTGDAIGHVVGCLGGIGDSRRQVYLGEFHREQHMRLGEPIITGAASTADPSSPQPRQPNDLLPHTA
jgi:hypothetical protein